MFIEFIFVMVKDTYLLNNASVPNNNMPISTNEIQGHKEMSTLPLVETTQPNNTINESSDNQFH